MISTKDLRLLLLVALVSCCWAAPVGPWTLKSDFENGMRQGWETYPLAEDAGYDPTLGPVMYQGRKALERHKAPNRDGEFRLGFVRKARVIAGPHPHLSFSYCVPSPGPVRLEVGVFSGDTPKLISLIARTGAWAQASVALPGIAGDATIRAISITAVFAAAQEGRQERFLIDDVELSAMREKNLEITQPTNLWDEDRRLHYVRRSYLPGQELAVTTNTSQVNVKLFDPKNRLVEEHPGTGAIHHFSANDEPGLWRAELASADGTATLLLLLRGTPHTGLLFDDLPPVNKELLDLMREHTAALRKSIHPEFGPNIADFNNRWLLPALPAYFNLLQPPAESALFEALQYRYDGDAQALSNARKILLSMASWPAWVHPWFTAHGYGTYYPVGIATGHLALTKDLIRSKLSPEDLKTIDQGLLEKSIVPAFNEYVLNDRIIFHTSNWIGHAVGGALLAALALDDPDVAGYALGLYTKQRDHLDATYTSDGSYGEGTSYMKFDMQTTSLVAAASKRHLGQNDDAPLIRSYKYLYYTSFGKGEALDHGDSHASLHPFGVFAYAASQNSDALLSRIYLENIDHGMGSLLSRIFWEAAIRKLPEAADLPRSAVFPIRGGVVLRSGWKPDATVIDMRASANFNHNHADQGSLSLAHLGQVLMSEAGYSDYYKDPYYQPYVIQAIGHNTLLVDGDPESQEIPGNHYLDGHPKIVDSFLGDAFDYVKVDLTPAYDARLERYTRTLLYQKDGALIVIDRVKGYGRHKYSVVWHPVAMPQSREGNGLMVVHGDAALDLQVFGSNPVMPTSEIAPRLLAELEKMDVKTDFPLPILRYTTRESPGETIFVSVLRPRAARQPAADFSWTRKDSGYELKAADLTVRLGATESLGLSATSGRTGVLIHGTQWQNGDRSISATTPVSLEVMEKRGSSALSIQTENPSELRLRGLAGLPDRIAAPAGPSKWPAAQ